MDMVKKTGKEVRMAIRSKEDILSSIKEKFKDDTTDSTLSFIEDINDTINDLESKAKDEQNWKQKYDENDRQWREKYKERFFSGGSEDGHKTPPDEDQHENAVHQGYARDGGLADAGHHNGISQADGEIEQQLQHHGDNQDDKGAVVKQQVVMRLAEQIAHGDSFPVHR